jgi:hypothetical protein
MPLLLLLLALYRSWRDTAARLAQYRQVAGHVGARWRNLRLAACFSTWRAATQRGLAKAAAWEAAGAHWRRRKLWRALQGWRTQTRVRNRHMQVGVRWLFPWQRSVVQVDFLMGCGQTAVDHVSLLDCAR